MRGTRDWKAIIDCSEDVDTRLSDGQKMAACKTVAHTAAHLHTLGELKDGEESKAALEVCMMLGIHPSQIDDESYRDVDLYRDAPSLDSVHR
jgi:predicted metal-dependent TIM-barrel fold hydrolase